MSLNNRKGSGKLEERYRGWASRVQGAACSDSLLSIFPNDQDFLITVLFFKNILPLLLILQEKPKEVV